VFHKIIGLPFSAILQPELKLIAKQVEGARNQANKESFFT